LVQQVVEQFSEALSSAQIKITCSLESDLVGIWDRHRLEQVIVNFISNAVKYAPKSSLNLRTERIDEKVKLTVEDTGPGISKEKLPLIFDRFERVDASENIGGLGLGLFIVKSIVEAHAGTIAVNSALGQGTKFTVELPLQAKDTTHV
jgi:signal transduction histidine kinase